MNGRDRHGLVAAALSVAKLPYSHAEDGISLTETITPDALGRTPANGSATSSASSTGTSPAAGST